MTQPQNPNARPQYQNQPVNILRDAKQGDAGFVAGQDQVVVRMPDGSERAVPRSEVTPQ